MPQPLVNSLICAAAILYLWFLFAVSYRNYRIAVLRHHLFAARDCFFERARVGELHFDDRAYGMVRTIMNGLIRSAESVTLSTVVVAWITRGFWSHPDLRRWFDERFASACYELSPRGKAAVSAAMTEVHFCVLSHILHTSFVLSPFFHLVKAVLRLSDRGKMSWARRLAEARHRTSLAKSLSEAFRTLDGEALILAEFEEDVRLAAA